MSRNVVLALLVIAIILGAASAYVFNQQKQKVDESLSPTTTETNTPTPKPTESTLEADFTEVKAAHFVSSTPKNNETLTTSPKEIRLRFNFTLGENSTIKISKNNSPISIPNPSIGSDRLALSVPFNEGEGSYLVDYTACWPDKSCHPGSFGFVIKP